ncbi:MAG: Sua5/YciO/YrdC/YwlC family protein, partial [Nevskiales bacterium]
QHSQRKTIGIRVPENPIALAMLGMINEPLMSCTLMLPGEPYPLSDPGDILDLMGHELDVLIDGGNCGLEPTSIIDLTGDRPQVIRAAKGDLSAFTQP